MNNNSSSNNNTPGPRYREFLPPFWILGLIATAVTVWLLLQLKEILLLLVLGYCLAFVIEPAICRIEQIKIRGRQLSRTASFFILVIGFFSALFLLTLTAIPTISKQYNRLETQLPVYIQQAQEKFTPLIQELKDKLPEQYRPEALKETPSSLLQIVNFDAVKRIFSAAFSTLVSGYSITLTLLNLLLLPFIVFYLSVDFQQTHRKLLLLVPKDLRLSTLRISREINSDISAFLGAQFVVCFIMFVLFLVSFWTIGLELSLLLAIIAGFGNLIPYLGTLCGIILASVMSLVVFGDWSHLLQVWGIFAVVQFLEGTFITPSIMGKNVGLSPLVVLLALLIGGQLLGLLGLLLAIPLTAAFKILLTELHTWLVQQDDVATKEP
jgi:predicted PurR-regulated permease PerM